MQGQLAWWIAGPVLAVCVVACRVLFDGRLGVTGGFSELVGQVRRGSLRFDWRGWFVIGILAGGAVYLAVHGGPALHGYGWLTDTFRDAVGVLVLLVAGVLIGFGAKLAGGCTSGNGLSGVSSLSLASVAATATFF